MRMSSARERDVDGAVYIAEGYDDYEAPITLGVYSALEDAIDCTERDEYGYHNYAVFKHFVDCDYDRDKWEEHRVHYARKRG